MKKLVLTAAILIGLSTVSSTFANDLIYRANLAETELNLKVLKGVKFKVSAINILKESILQIKDTSGNVLFKGIVNNGNYEKIFDLSPLPDGKYFFILSTDREITKRAFEIQTETKRSVSADTK
ncbi:MAG: hypothetical protein ACI9DJ_000004 [Algoriphagus sp.]|jgi:hypothetical protein